LGLSGAAVVCAFVAAAIPVDSQSVSFLVMLILLGGAVNAVQTTMYVLAANVYPAEIRGTGIGTAVAVGRIGNVLASYLGNFALDVGGAPAYFSSFAVGMVIVFISLASIRRHIGATLTEVAPPKVIALRK
jgi:AAHS family 4-hydroxybenzoate transporter-like MFS transporter